jgi:hypothetical protein
VKALQKIFFGGCHMAELFNLKGRSYGFFVTLCVAVLSLVTAIVYAACYQSTPRFMDWNVLIIMVVGIVLSLAMLFVKMPKGFIISTDTIHDLAGVPMALANLIGLMLYIEVIYNYVAVVMVGIDLGSLSGEFIACTLLLVLSFVAALVNVFLRQDKAEIKEGV